MAELRQQLPVPPEAAWNVLPAGVDAVGGVAPYYDSMRGTVSTRTGLTWRSYGQEIVARVDPLPGGALLTVHTSLKFGVVDWGEGKKFCGKFAAAVTAALGLPTPPA